MHQINPLTMMVRDSKIVLKKSEKVALQLDGEFKDIKAFTEHTLKIVWDNPYDEVWNKDAPSANSAAKRKIKKS
jgi:hypothetical protein